jgi:elongation factor 1-alpha
VHYHDGHISGVGYLKLPKQINKDKKKLRTNGSIDFINGSKMFLNNSVFNHNPKVGDVISVQKEVLEAVESFICQVAVQEHPGQLKTGFSPCVHVRTAKSACKMTKINWKIGKKTGEHKLENPPFLERGEQAEIEFEPQQPIYMESFDKCEGLGRIAVMDSNNLVMLGKVISVEYKPYK